jgi:hypothetical protein
MNARTVSPVLLLVLNLPVWRAIKKIRCGAPRHFKAFFSLRLNN